MTHHPSSVVRCLSSEQLVREEREMKTAASCKQANRSENRSALMFPRDPIETREAPLKDHP